MATALGLAHIEEPLRERRTGVGAWPGALRSFARRKPLGALGGLIVVVMLFAAVFVDAAPFGFSAQILAPDHYNRQVFGIENQGPSWAHPMGTDRAGRDILSRILYGARISAIIGFSCVVLAALISLFVGTISGFYAGWIDTIVQRFVDVVLAIPAIVLVIFALTVFASGASAYEKMVWIIAIVGFIFGVNSIRVVRGAAISVAQNQYIDAARTIGASNARIIAQHIAPNVVPVAIVLASVQVGSAILAEATISFLGYGIPDPFPSWGAMLGLQGSSQFRAQPLQAVWPGLAIALAVYGYNILGDALRDVLDPRLRGGR